MAKKKIWVPERVAAFDPRYSYLHILTSENQKQGIRVKFNKAFYKGNHVDSAVALSAFFALDEYGSWQECVREAKSHRNTYAESILGDQFMRYGAMPRMIPNSNNTSGHVGVFEKDIGQYTAFWRERVDPKKYDITPKYMRQERVCKSANFIAENQSAAAAKRAFKAACDYREKMVAIHYPDIDAMRKLVLTDTEAESDLYVGVNKLISLAK